jgi:hypothetical protein
MTRRVLSLLIVAIVTIILLYLSRFWVFDLWSRAGLFGVTELRPDGGLLARWLRGTPFAPFELLIWACGVFVVLTWVQKLYDRFGKS